MVVPGRNPISWTIDWLVENRMISESQALLVEKAAFSEWGNRSWGSFAPRGPRQRANDHRLTYERAVSAVTTSDEPIDDVASALGVSRATLYRLMKRAPNAPRD